MLERSLETEEGGAQRNRHLHREVLARALEKRVRLRLELEHHVSGYLSGLLLGLVLEGDLLVVGHAFLDCGAQLLLLPLALLLGLHHDLLLHNHPRPSPLLDHLLLLGAGAASHAARLIRILLAVAADDPPLDSGELLVTHIEIVEGNGQLDVHIPPAVRLPLASPAAKEHVERRAASSLVLLRLACGGDAGVIIDNPFLLVGEDFVSLRHLTELEGHLRFVRAHVLVGVVLDGESPVSFLDLPI
mmetsp:Transcript_36232/g.77270  ORF Transcript_36232/g.77270 Transcript_36232/m.77270 type:complete len:245 (-) Transcript_36232:361-1095(-)